MFQGNPGLDTEDVGSQPQTTQEHLKKEGQKASGFDLLSLIFFIDQFDTRRYKVNFG